MVVLLPIYGAAQSRTQRCRLEDLCPEDRGKLARLVMELALAQEAVGKQSPMGSSAKPVWNVENDSFGDAIKNRQVSAQSDSSSASKAQTLHNKPVRFRFGYDLFDVYLQSFWMLVYEPMAVHVRFFKVGNNGRIIICHDLSPKTFPKLITSV